MNPFSACINQQQSIRLSTEQDEEHERPTRHRNCTLGWPFGTCLGGRQATGRIRLPDDAAADDILEDYLDPNTTVGIEPLLAQHAIPDNQVEDDDDDDDDNKQFMKHDMFDEPHRFLSRNPFATTSSSSGILGSTDFYDEDAQFLSDRRISDVLEQNQEDDKEEKENMMDNKDEEFGQELVDVVRAPKSKALEDWTQMDHEEELVDTTPTTTTTTHAESSQKTTTQSTFVTTSIRPKEESTPINKADDFPILGLPRTQIVTPTPIPATPNKPATPAPAEDEATFALPPPSPPTPVPETTTPMNDLPLLETEQQQQHPLDTHQQQQPDIQLIESTTQNPVDTLTTDSQVDDTSNNKRTSVAATMAQSILGDRLDDFTEKLAFIKKNIIMSLEDEENWDEDDRVLKPSLSETTKRRTSFDPLVKPTRERSTPPVMQQQRQHKRSSSLMDVASPAIARFLNQMSGEGNGEENGNRGSFSPSSFFASLAAPEDHASDNTEAKRNHHQDPLLAQPQPRQRPPRVVSPSILPLQEEEEEEEGQDDEEELFDFNKMFTLGKSVFNDVANRVKNANKQQQQQQQQQQQADEQGNDNWIIDRQAWI
ncbi:hypothetical protein K492DRAFT_238844 [Lichtheimia hyalospora FSU 10163]|nr:hypothetical protein K492DRAFT_238844 [Lichtheimia hyalospora FSU 10163]